MDDEAELRDVEAELREAVAVGGILDFSSPDTDENDSSQGNAWDASRTLPASLIAKLAACPLADDQIATTIAVRGAKVTGSLELRGMQTLRALHLENCYFEKAVILLETEIVSLRLPGSYLAEGFEGSNIRVRGSLELNDGFHSAGPTYLGGADIGGNLICAGGHFIEPNGLALYLNTAEIKGNAVLGHGFKSNGLVRMDDAQLRGQLLCTAGNFENPGHVALSADRVLVGGSVHCAKEFVADGEVRMLGASINGPLVCTGGQFKQGREGHALSLDRASILGGVYCADGFVALGEVRLPGSRIGNQLTCGGGHFLNEGGTALFGEGASINGSAVFDDGFIAKGALKIRSADIQGTVSFTGGTFLNPGEASIQLGDTTVGSTAYFLQGFSSEGSVNLNGTQINGQLIFEGEISSKDIALDLENARVAKDFFLMPSKPLSGWIDCTNTRVGHLHDSEDAWNSGYELGGMQYETVQGQLELTASKAHWWSRDPVLTRRMKWLAGNRYGYQPQIYDQLARVYSNAGHASMRRRVLIEKQRRRRSVLTLTGKAWSWLEDALIGFGYRTWLAMIPFGILLVLGSLFFDAHRGDIGPKNSDLQAPDLHSFTYTLDLLVPVVTLGLRENYVAQGCAQTVSTIYIIAGWILTTAIIAALTGLVRRTD